MVGRCTTGGLFALELLIALEKLYSEKLKENKDQSIHHYEEKIKKIEEKLAALEQNVDSNAGGKIQEPTDSHKRFFLYKGLLCPT